MISCAICFLIAAPILVLYSEGYRFDFEKMKVVATGGIFVRTFPSADQITIDSAISEKPGFLANSIFVQSLLPKTHTILVIKKGYYDYNKTLSVEENSVTKLENVLLFKKDIKFTPLTDLTKSPFLPENQQEKFIIRNNSLYYSDIPQNSSITAAVKKNPLLKNLIAFETSGNKIFWLSTDGFLYQSEVSAIPASADQIFAKLNLTALKINKKGIYKIITDGQNIFLNDNGGLYILDSKTDNFVALAAPIIDANISPDSKNLAYSAGNEIFIYTISADPARTFLRAGQKNILYKSNSPVTSALWLNNDYIIFSSQNNVTASEIDFRGNVNSVVLSESLKSPQIYLSRQDSKLYILSGKTLLLSEKLTP
ncbi:MAG: hypothetical protein NT026_01645 [Candidatus Staskawiczbacteria bacterium]|nr:hypothetical protein [Candidatus Staskawiczbacteria bacterium]